MTAAEGDGQSLPDFPTSGLPVYLSTNTTQPLPTKHKRPSHHTSTFPDCRQAGTFLVRHSTFNFQSSGLPDSPHQNKKWTPFEVH